MTIPRFLEGFNVSGAISRMLDQPELWWQALGMFVGHFADWRTEWELTIGNPAQEQKKVHAIRSAAANIGAEPLAAAAAAMEEFLLNGPSDAQDDGEALRQRLEAAYSSAWQAASAARGSRPIDSGSKP